MALNCFVNEFTTTLNYLLYPIAEESDQCKHTNVCVDTKLSFLCYYTSFKTDSKYPYPRNQ